MKRLSWLLTLLMLFATTGASCPRTMRHWTHQTPPALPPCPTLAQVIEVVNRNSDAIETVWTDRASVTTPETPSLRAQLAISRPGRLRMVAETSLTGTEVDLGSNEELFWFWVKRDPQKAIYFCRHDQFAASRARQMVPIEPSQLIEAVGLARFDPALPHHGPTVRRDGALQVRTVRETETGTTTKVTTVDPHSGWVLEQAIYDEADRLVFQAIADSHRRDPLTGLVMPRVVRINCPLNQFSMRMNLGNVEINTLRSNRPELWTMPHFPDTGIVNLADPNLRLAPVSSAGRPLDRDPLAARPRIPW